MHKIIFRNAFQNAQYYIFFQKKNYVSMTCDLKFSDLLPETHFLFYLN